MMLAAAFRAIFRGEKAKNEFRPAQNISIIAFYITSTLKVTYTAGVTTMLVTYITIT